MADYLADNAADIAKRWAEIQEEKRQAIMGKPLEEPQGANAIPANGLRAPEPNDVGWPYGAYGNGYYQNALNPYTQPSLCAFLMNAHREESLAALMRMGGFHD